ncbi:MAG: XdhC family protein [Pseudanabaenaceae cyanobacterium bins.39]|nr:XdhC family protein [Pseudanabaenaceae cyanobacterium bins.39]
MIYEDLLTCLRQGAVVVATVIKTTGSVPREVGAKMLITGDRCWDTIGGGAGEAKVISHAQQILQSGQKQCLKIDLTGAISSQPMEGICGGLMEVWLERWQGESAIATVEQIITQLKRGQSVTLITPYDDGIPYIGTSPTSQSVSPAFIETIQPEPTLLIIGAGHVGEQLAKIGHLLGFQIAIQDDRSDWANQERYPQAIALYDQIETALSQLSHHQHLYIALVTRGYRQDLTALTAILNQNRDYIYIGMIGSQRRIQQVLREIDQIGIPKAKLRSLYAPIGLQIGALTPAEIAVSIAAEIIMVRRQFN